MIPYLGCDGARGMLEASADGELGVHDQVVLEAHLRWCDTCRARLMDVRALGSALRLGAAASGAGQGRAASLAAMQDELLMRIRAEREQSLPVRCRAALADTRYLWPALGAPLAVVLCLCAATMVNRSVRSERPGSMAAILSVLASPGSDRNPLFLDSAMLAPRPLAGSALDIPADEAEFAVAAVVTREGRVVNYELLQPVHEQTGRPSAAAQPDDITALLELVRRSRFEPALVGGDPVAVNVVWLLARTTVKASAVAGSRRRRRPGQRRAGGAGASPRALVTLLSESVARMITPRGARSPSSASSNCSARESGIPSFG